MIRLWIKGNIEEAIAWAGMHNVPIRNEREIEMAGRQETIAETDECHRANVVRWFCDAGQCEENTGYPPGTMLLHT